MLSCKETTELISQGMDRRLSLPERMGLRLHLLVCRGCRATEQHLEFLRTATRAWQQHHDLPSTQQGETK